MCDACLISFLCEGSITDCVRDPQLTLIFLDEVHAVEVKRLTDTVADIHVHIYHAFISLFYS